MANSVVINHQNIIQGNNAIEFYYDFASNGLPYLRLRDKNQDYYQYVINTNNNELRIETNSGGTWHVLYKFPGKSSLFYEVGESCSNISGGSPANGFVTSSGKDLVITVPLSKFTNNISSITFTSFNIALRIPTGGYVLSGDNPDVLSYVNIKRFVGTNMHLTLSKNDGWGVTNNIPVLGTVGFTGTFS